MVNKFILITILAVLLVGAGWFAWRGLPSRDSTNLGADNLASTSTKIDIGGVVIDTSPGAGIKVATLQEEALDLINQQVVFYKSFPSEIEADLKSQISDLYSSIRENYDNLDAWNSLGQLRKVIGDYEGARDAWEFGSLIRPKNSLTFHNLGDLYGLYLNDLEKAKENYLQSVANDPENIPAYINLAELYWNAGEPKYQRQVPGFLMDGLENNLLAENRIPLLARLAKYYSEIGENQKAIDYYEEVLSLDPSVANIVQPEIDRLRNE